MVQQTTQFKCVMANFSKDFIQVFFTKIFIYLPKKFCKVLTRIISYYYQIVSLNKFDQSCDISKILTKKCIECSVLSSLAVYQHCVTLTSVIA